MRLSRGWPNSAFAAGRAGPAPDRLCGPAIRAFWSKRPAGKRLSPQC